MEKKESMFRITPTAATACACLMAAGPAAALPFNFNQATTFVSLGSAAGFTSDSDTTASGSDGSSAARLSSGSEAAGGSSSASARTDLFEDGPDGLALTTSSAVSLQRADAAGSSRSGFAGLEPSQVFNFVSPGGPLRLTYTATGVVAVENELQANNSFANFAFSVVRRGGGDVDEVAQARLFSPESYSVTQTVEFDTEAGDLLAVSLDNGVTGFIEGPELSASVTADLDLRFTLVPEPAGLSLLAAGGALLLGRRRR